MEARQFRRLLGAEMVMACATLLSPPILMAPASAAPCPDVEVTFARGTNEPAGVGGVGQAFVDSLRSQVGGRSLGVYAVNYPATEDWPPSASAGASDANAHVRSMVANCPNTKLVLGGYSQGAMVIDLITIARASIAG
ncbi:cutinase family protein, partial [Mycobacterium seoulense]